jgi:hypothetical protein
MESFAKCSGLFFFPVMATDILAACSGVLVFGTSLFTKGYYNPRSANEG